MLEGPTSLLVLEQRKITVNRRHQSACAGLAVHCCRLFKSFRMEISSTIANAFRGGHFADYKEHGSGRIAKQQVRPKDATLVLWQQALEAHGGQIVDLFRRWDKDNSGRISRLEFRKALMLLGMRDGEELGALFDYFDKDNSGSLSLLEFEGAVVHGQRTAATPLAAANAVALRKFTQDRAHAFLRDESSACAAAADQPRQLDTASANGISELVDELHVLLAARAGRVRALFAAWLDEEAQPLSRRDFWLAMSPLGIAVDRRVVNLLFDRIAPSRGAAFVELDALSRALQAPPRAEPRSAAAGPGTHDAAAAATPLTPRPPQPATAHGEAASRPGSGRRRISDGAPPFGCSLVRVLPSPRPEPRWSHERHRTTDPRHFDHVALRSPRVPRDTPGARPASAQRRATRATASAAAAAAASASPRRPTAVWQHDPPPIAPLLPRRPKSARVAERGCAWPALAAPFVPPAGGLARGTVPQLERYEAFLRSLAKPR